MTLTNRFSLNFKLKFQVQPFSKLEVFDTPECIQLIRVIVDTRKCPIPKFYLTCKDLSNSQERSFLCMMLYIFNVLSEIELNINNTIFSYN